MKTVYSYNPINREFNGEIIARKDPLEKKEKFLVPANAVEEKPIFQEGKITKFVNGQWILENISLPPEPPEPTLEEELQEAKTSKLSQLDKNRNDFCLIPIEYQGNFYATTINAWAAISYLANGLATLSTEAAYPNYPQGDNITLTKADFKNIANLIQAREMASRDLRKSKIDEINAIVIDGEYFDDQDQPITPVQALNAININFN